MTTMPPFYSRLAAAYVRGAIEPANKGLLDSLLLTTPLDELDAAQYQALIQIGSAQGLHLHRFKRTMGLARVNKVLGILHSINPHEVLDIGSGRGAFLWPLLDAMPWLPVTVCDILPQRVTDIQRVAQGGVPNLHAVHANVATMPFAASSFDVVTMLEVLEHIPDTRAALRGVFRVAKRFIIFSVPSRPDDNPEHLHLFDSQQLAALLYEIGASRVSFDHVPGHLIAIAKV